LIFAFQAKIARSRLAHRIVRTSFLLFVLVWLGLDRRCAVLDSQCHQLCDCASSISNIGFYLAEPLMVIIALTRSYRCC